MAEFTARTSSRIPPSPPRVTGDAEADRRAITEWLQAFFNNAVVETGLLDTEYQKSGTDIDFDTEVPDPASTTIARAQATANEAINRANAAQNSATAADVKAQQGIDVGTAAQTTANTAITRLDALNTIVTGSFTVSDGDTSAAVTFSEALPAASYRMVATASTYTGSPSVTAFAIAAMTKGTGGATFTLVSAPGAGASVTFDFILIL